MQETWVQSLGWEDPLEKGKATHSSILAWRIPWTIQSVGSQRVGHDCTNFTFIFCSKLSPKLPYGFHPFSPTPIAQHCWSHNSRPFLQPCSRGTWWTTPASGPLHWLSAPPDSPCQLFLRLISSLHSDFASDAGLIVGFLEQHRKQLSAGMSCRLLLCGAHHHLSHFFGARRLWPETLDFLPCAVCIILRAALATECKLHTYLPHEWTKSRCKKPPIEKEIP